MLVKRIVVENKTKDLKKHFIVSGFVDIDINDALAFEELTSMSAILQQAIYDKDCDLEYKSDIVFFMDYNIEEQQEVGINKYH